MAEQGYFTIQNQTCTYGSERLTFVLQCAVCGLQHCLVEVLSKGLRCEPLPGLIPSILWLLFVRRCNHTVLGDLELPDRLSLCESGLFMIGGQGGRDASPGGVHGLHELVVTEEMLRFV